MMKPFVAAIDDFRHAMRQRGLWLALASEDIADQHRRTTLGPAWLLLNYLAFAGTFAVVFDGSNRIEYYPAYIAVGLLVWMFLSEVIQQALTLFMREANLIKGTVLPVSIFVMRMSMKSIIRLAYALVGCLMILLVCGPAPGFSWLWGALGLLLILVTLPAVITIFAFAGAYYPDLQLFVSNIMRIGMFLTPIFWKVGSDSGIRAHLYRWNPFTYFLEIVRGPVMNGTPHFHALALCGSISIAMWIGALWLLGSLRRQIVHVL
jgi:lipopolysaccharide transport system permease protein